MASLQSGLASLCRYMCTRAITGKLAQENPHLDIEITISRKLMRYL